ncbi:MAG TPA: TolC family protein [Gemmatimonadaceae bacterium]|nr:TolC family protein [Gemmatimonadaceae bacterium]
MIVWLPVGAGCARYVARPIAPARAAARLEARRLSDPGVTNALRAQDATRPTPAVAWTLGTLTTAALYFSPALGVARADWSVAQAGVVTAGARPNPDLAVDVAAITHGGTPSPSLLSTLLDWPVVTAGKRGLAVAEARAHSLAQRWRVQSVAWEVRRDVRDAALAVWEAEQAVDRSTTEVDTETTLVQFVQRRLAVGEISALALGEQQLALARTRAALSTDRTRLASARAGLAGAVGIPIEALDSVRLSLEAFGGPLPEPPPPIEARATALLTRSDLQAALADYAAAQEALQLEIARQYPDVTIGAGLHWERELGGLTVTPALPLAILNRNRGPIAAADAKREASAARFTQLQAAAMSAVDRAGAEYAASRRALAAADSVAAQEQTLAGRADALVRAGASDRVTLLEATLAVLSARRNQLAARTQAWTALGALESALQRPLIGGGWTMPAIGADSTGRRATP